MTKTIEQHLRDKLVVLGTPEMVGVIYGSYDSDEQPGGYYPEDVAGIIHLVYHDIDAPGAKRLPSLDIPDELRRLPGSRNHAHMQHHFSELFYGSLQFKEIASDESVKDMMALNAQGMVKAMELGNFLDIKRQDLSDALEFAKDIVASDDHRKLFIYVACGNKWAPLVALGVIAQHLGEGKEKEAIQLLRDVCPFERPNFLPGHLAFLDHAMGRGGKLIEAWAVTPSNDRFDADKARSYYQSFEVAAYAYYGPRRGAAELRQQMREFNP